jgi:hypothetical protein
VAKNSLLKTKHLCDSDSCWRLLILSTLSLFVCKKKFIVGAGFLFWRYSQGYCSSSNFSNISKNDKLNICSSSSLETKKDGVIFNEIWKALLIFWLPRYPLLLHVVGCSDVITPHVILPFLQTYQHYGMFSDQCQSSSLSDGRFRRLHWMKAEKWSLISRKFPFKHAEKSFPKKGQQRYVIENRNFL